MTALAKKNRKSETVHEQKVFVLGEKGVVVDGARRTRGNEKRGYFGEIHGWEIRIPLN